MILNPGKLMSLSYLSIIFRQSCENYDYNNQEYFCQNTLGFPINNYVKKVANGLFNPIELQNSGKNFGRQSLQPFLLQHLLRQQQIAKCKFILKYISIL